MTTQSNSGTISFKEDSLSPNIFNDPVYKTDFFTDWIEDDRGNDFQVLVVYNYYWNTDFYLGEVKRIVEYKFHALGDYTMTPESLNESLRESIRLHESDVVFEVDKPEV